MYCHTKLNAQIVAYELSCAASQLYGCPLVCISARNLIALQLSSRVYKCWVWAVMRSLTVSWLSFRVHKCLQPHCSASSCWPPWQRTNFCTPVLQHQPVLFAVLFVRDKHICQYSLQYSLTVTKNTYVSTLCSTLWPWQITYFICMAPPS
jgi:hypothetical protein